ncbi:unnamed protein product [Effrenium voratum]|nr:unnamed protein product [Effrenium voratum]
MSSSRRGSESLLSDCRTPSSAFFHALHGKFTGCFAPDWKALVGLNGEARRIPQPPSAGPPVLRRPSFSGRKLMEAQVQDELDCAGHSLSDLAQRFEQRQKVRSRLHGPALDWSRQTSEDSNASVTEFNFLFEGTSGTA